MLNMLKIALLIIASPSLLLIGLFIGPERAKRLTDFLKPNKTPVDPASDLPVAGRIMGPAAFGKGERP